MTHRPAAYYATQIFHEGSFRVNSTKAELPTLPSSHRQQNHLKCKIWLVSLILRIFGPTASYHNLQTVSQNFELFVRTFRQTEHLEMK